MTEADSLYRQCVLTVVERSVPWYRRTLTEEAAQDISFAARLHAARLFKTGTPARCLRGNGPSTLLSGLLRNECEATDEVAVWCLKFFQPAALLSESCGNEPVMRLAMRHGLLNGGPLLLALIARWHRSLLQERDPTSAGWFPSTTLFLRFLELRPDDGLDLEPAFYVSSDSALALRLWRCARTLMLLDHPIRDLNVTSADALLHYDGHLSASNSEMHSAVLALRDFWDPDRRDTRGFARTKSFWAHRHA